jgi:ParB family chromosome partitioning protein
MSIKHHYIKCETEYFQAVEKGKKTFEVRKNDRDYQQHDILHLKESVEGIETGRTMTVSVTYIMYGGKLGLHAAYCVMSINKEGEA